jgi:predicted Ser/Thr protein kinase
LVNKNVIRYEDIEVGNELGKGSYGRVCLGQWRGATVALKFCKEKGGLNEFWREASLMRYTPSQQMRKNVIK